MDLGFASPFQFPQKINYQGRIKRNDLPLNALGYFRFAIIQKDPNTGDVQQVVWTNDASGLLPPKNPVEVKLNDGKFNVQLGDDKVTNMTMIPANAFKAKNLVLRSWYAEEAGGTPLVFTPDREILAVPYAFNANSITDGDVTNAKIILQTLKNPPEPAAIGQIFYNASANAIGLRTDQGWTKVGYEAGYGIEIIDSVITIDPGEVVPKDNKGAARIAIKNNDAGGVARAISLIHENKNGAGNDGIGSAIAFVAETKEEGTMAIPGSIQAVLVNASATENQRQGELRLATLSNGVMQDAMALTPDGSAWIKGNLTVGDTKPHGERFKVQGVPKPGNGTITCSDKDVTGSGTNFSGQLMQGYELIVDGGMIMEVESIQDDTHLKVTAPQTITSAKNYKFRSSIISAITYFPQENTTQVSIGPLRPQNATLLVSGRDNQQLHIGNANGGPRLSLWSGAGHPVWNVLGGAANVVEFALNDGFQAGITSTGAFGVGAWPSGDTMVDFMGNRGVPIAGTIAGYDNGTHTLTGDGTNFVADLKKGEFIALDRAEIIRVIDITDGTHLIYDRDIVGEHTGGSIWKDMNSLFKVRNCGNVSVFDVSKNGTVRIGESIIINNNLVVGESYQKGYLTAINVVATANDTPLVYPVFFLGNDDMACDVEVVVSAIRQGGAARASYHLIGTFYRDGGGGATLQGAVTSVHAVESVAGWDCELIVSNNDIQVRVTGDAANNVSWKIVSKTSMVEFPPAP